MKNIVVLGVSQTGLFELTSLIHENVANEKGYQLLGGFFNVFGDLYKIDEDQKHADKSLASYSEGAYKRSFILDENQRIKEFRDYGLPLMGNEDVISQLESRFDLLKKAQGHYVIALSSWELTQLKEKAPKLSNEFQQFLNNSETIVVDVDKGAEAAASYTLANETGRWVRSNEDSVVKTSRVTAKKNILIQFEQELNIVRDLSRKYRSVKMSEVESGSAALKKLFGVNANKAALFTCPKYEGGSLRYITNSEELKRFNV